MEVEEDIRHCVKKSLISDYKEDVTEINFDEYLKDRWKCYVIIKTDETMEIFLKIPLMR